MKQAEMNLDAPVAGMSLTSELGGRPWQKPPQYNTVDEAVDYYVTRLNSDDASEQVVDVLEMGVTPSKLANIIQLGSVMEGVHSIDVGVLVTPVIMEFIKLIGDSSNVKYKSEEDEIDDKTKRRLSDKALSKFKLEMQDANNEDTSTSDLEMPMQVNEEELTMKEESPELPTGLMARRTL
tara:strand:+ start:284 stop:823 length:540 start_codon:yes stop_codon:yes gene_type:complete